MAATKSLPRAARVVVPLGLALVFGTQAYGAPVPCGCTFGLVLVAAVCGILALDVALLAIPHWDLAAMVETGFAFALASATPVVHGATALERAFDYRGSPTTPACWAIAAGTGVAISILLGVSAFKSPAKAGTAAT